MHFKLDVRPNLSNELGMHRGPSEEPLVAWYTSEIKQRMEVSDLGRLCVVKISIMGYMNQTCWLSRISDLMYTLYSCPAL